MRRKQIRLQRETLRIVLTGLEFGKVNAGRMCTDSCDTCPSLWLTCVGNTCTA